MAEKTTTKKATNTKTAASVKKAPAEKVTTNPKKTQTVKEEAAVKAATPSTKSKKDISVDVYDLSGKVTGKVVLPGEIFAEEINKSLLAQAVRVYLANKRQGTVSTKTRGEVDGSTRKIYRQKGTGRARHGSIRAPIFVKGGVVFGPKPRDYSLAMPQKMRRKALFAALSAKVHENGVKVVSGMDGMQQKTKIFAAMLAKLGIGNKSVLVIMGEEKENIKRASRNLQGVVATGATRINAYDVLRAKNVLLMKEAVEVLEKHFVDKK